MGLPSGLAIAFDPAGEELERRELGPIGALAVMGDALVRAAGTQVVWHDKDDIRWEAELGEPVTAVAASQHGVAVGLRDGTLVLLSLDGRSSRRVGLMNGSSRP
ncbi:MAG: hypothetical protein KC912_08605 [Proteobacteria bacterium]|nr:hypothetical protein [Pseudomonadota bacterium]